MKHMINKINSKMIAASAMLSTVMSTATYATNTTTNNAQGVQLDNVVNPILALINSLLGPALAVVGALGTLYCVLLGVKFAKAEEPQEREKAKSHLKNAVIGFVLIFVMILVLNLSMDPLIAWVESNTKAGGNAVNIG